MRCAHATCSQVIDPFTDTWHEHRWPIGRGEVDAELYCSEPCLRRGLQGDYAPTETTVIQ